MPPAAAAADVASPLGPACLLARCCSTARAAPHAGGRRGAGAAAPPSCGAGLALPALGGMAACAVRRCCARPARASRVARAAARAPAPRQRAGPQSQKAAAGPHVSAAYLLRQRRLSEKRAKSAQEVERERRWEQSMREKAQADTRSRSRRVEADRRCFPEPKSQSYPTCVATWHAKFKCLSSGDFFELAADDPDILPAYYEQAALESIMDEEDPIVPQAAQLLHEALRVHPAAPAAPRPWRVVDLGCGRATLATELAALPWPAGRAPAVTSVDAAPLAPGVEVHNIGELPANWAGRFDVAVLCRALWGTDYRATLGEARRVLRPSAEARLLVVEPFRRWWGKDKSRPQENILPGELQAAGFRLDASLCSNTELPAPGADGEGRPADRMEGVFQYIVAQLS
ncbi:unnamed protein product [Prorocentrum cordatum]|uniref:Ribosomal RNA-processing protein 8 n=1 Tax=Prorocentrum cordatum TaxID=2364126 RepID=A0ABN9SGX1_9DINO|nr:unnamed protein product [Polarella glacialis]